MKQSLAFRPPPSEADVRSELERLLGFEPLRKSPQLVSFLRYVIDAQLTHQSSKIKGYTIAIDALGRDPSFDPQRDPIVRVEAVRLRRILAAYYNGPGALDVMRITMPPGGYVPVFKWVENDIASVPSPPIVPESAQPQSTHRAMTIVGVAIAALAGTVLIGQLGKVAFDYVVAGLFAPT